MSPDRRVYNKRHIAGATYSDLHKELALRGTAPETGDAEREWLVPTREQAEAVLRRWRVGDGDRVVLYDDVGLNRHAIRGYWLLRLYGFPRARVHILDGGIEAWRRADQPTTTDVPEADLADALRVPVKLGERDDTLVATYDEVLAWSRESSRGADAPTRILDVRTASEYVGADLRAKRGGHIPGARLRFFGDLLTDEGTFRPVDDMVALVRASRCRPWRDPGDVLPGRRSRRARVVRPPRAGRLRGRPQLRRVVGGVGEPGRQPDRDTVDGHRGRAKPRAILSRGVDSTPITRAAPASRPVPRVLAPA